MGISMKTRQTIACATDGTKLLVERVCERMLWLNFILVLQVCFLQSLGMVMYDKEFETKENRIL